jgi:hypothetical protein
MSDQPELNGIDFLEIVDRAAPTEADRQRKLEVHFVKPLGSLKFTKDNIRVEGGERITPVRVLGVTVGSGTSDLLTVEVDQRGDYSLYTLRLITGPKDDRAPLGIDPQLAVVEFSFKAECPTPFDCAPQHSCPEEPKPAPVIDYLAKDYASFRRIMLDRMSVLMPQWKERSPADVGIMLVEALAYTADQLSYQQDAVATEAYLGTARRRISVRRHARLMDYFVSEGCNARAWVHLQVSADVDRRTPADPVVPAGTKLTTSILNRPPTIPDDPTVYGEAAAIFETMEPVRFLYAAHNEIPFYTWSDQRCCLRKGATSATLMGDGPNGPSRLMRGDILVIEEAVGPVTGVPGDSNPRHRHAVRLTRVVPEAEPILAKDDQDREVEVGRKAVSPPLLDPVTGQAIVEIFWSEEDALPFPLCLSAKSKAGFRDQVSVARGNVVLADHGVTVPQEEFLGTVPEPFLFLAPGKAGDRCEPVAPEPVPPRFRPGLARGPLTHAATLDLRGKSARGALQSSLRDVRPAIRLTGTKGSDTRSWEARRDLLNSNATADEYVVEIENDGAGRIRFGDDMHGRRPEPGTEFFARYRVGNGRSGNIGADSLRHLALNLPEITLVGNPLPAAGGQEPESLEDVRQRAPVAYRIQERAVTPADYAEVTERHSAVQRAAATFRWTGSWHTVFVTTDRIAGMNVTNEFEDEILKHIERYRMAGHDLEVDGPRFVSLEIDLHVCVTGEYFRSDVERELYEVLSNRDLPDARRGLFHPDNFTFGQPVYLSTLYAAAHQVMGVESVEIRTFQRQGVPDTTALDTGRLDIGRLEIARLDNDRNFAEHGRLTITLGGGK